MIILEHSTFDAATIGRNLGMPEYSYWFVRKAFRPVLERFGVVLPLAKPQADVERIHRSARAHGQSCVYASFNPPHLAPVELDCPVVPVFAWEYDVIPNEVWNNEPANDWTQVLARAPAAITHSRFSAEAVRRALGPDYPVWSIPAPVFDRQAGLAASAQGWRREPFELSFGQAMVFDSWNLDLSLFTYGDDARSLRALRLLQTTAAAEAGRPARRVSLQGVVYTSVFNPVDGRKNWYDMLAGFVYALRDQADATLILKATHRDLAEGVLLILQDLAKLGRFRCRILIVQGMLGEGDYAALVEATSYTVNTSHGEGQCLPLMEFMSAGRPALAPRHTAMTDYISADDAFVISDHQRPAFWPHDVRQAIRCLRHQVDFADVVRCYRESFAVARDDPARYAAMSRAAVEALRGFCSDEVVAAGLQQVLDHLGAQPDVPPWGQRSGVSSVEETAARPSPPIQAQTGVDGLLGLKDAMEALKADTSPRSLRDPEPLHRAEEGHAHGQDAVASRHLSSHVVEDVLAVPDFAGDGRQPPERAEARKSNRDSSHRPVRLGLANLTRRFSRPARAAPMEAVEAAPPMVSRPTLPDLARDLGDGEPCPPALLAALDAEIQARRRRTDTLAGPASPLCSDLSIRRAGLPDWWAEADNLLLAGPDARVPDLRQNPFKLPIRGAVLVLGARVVFDHINFGGDDALVVIGDHVYSAVGALSCLDGSTVLIGERTTATNWAMLDACNGGMIVTGQDGMWAHGLSLLTDDTHAIRDVASGRRLNTFGGRIVIEHHVWLGENSRILGGARIGHDCVIGAGTMVKNVEIAAHSVCVGVPARVVRSGVTWSREDKP